MLFIRRFASSIIYFLDILYFAFLQRVKLHFSRYKFDLEQCDDTCNCDKVSIYDGSSATAPLIHSICSSKFLIDVVTSSGNTVFVYFESDTRNRRRGFEIQYSSVEGK